MKKLPVIGLSTTTLLMLLMSVGSALGKEYRWSCELHSEPIVEVAWSEKEQSYVVWDVNSTGIESGASPNQGGRRELLDSDLLEDDSSDSASFLRGLRGFPSPGKVETTLLVSRQAQAGIEDEEAIQAIQVRRCPCWSYSSQEKEKDFYCPVARTHCGLSSPLSMQGSDGLQPGCLDVSRQRALARNVWPVITIWYLAMFICLLLTRPGKHAIGYCISWCWSDWNVYTTNRIIAENPSYADRVVLRHIAMNTAARNSDHNNANQSENDSNNRMEHAGFEITFESFPMTSDSANNNSSKELLLHTKTYHSGVDSTHKTKEGVGTSDSGCENANYESSSDSEEGGDKGLEVTIEGNTHFEDGDDDTLVACAICHTEIEDGDRVGDLPCGHIMHIHCLKTWIPRRNVCPLCRAENIATPRDSSSSSDIIVHDNTTQPGTGPQIPEFVATGE